MNSVVVEKRFRRRLVSEVVCRPFVEDVKLDLLGLGVMGRNKKMSF
jgi:hypothetical protein